jgi:hypothetical protein
MAPLSALASSKFRERIEFRSSDYPQYGRRQSISALVSFATSGCRALNVRARLQFNSKLS